MIFVRIPVGAGEQRNERLDTSNFARFRIFDEILFYFYIGVPVTRNKIAWGTKKMTRNEPSRNKIWHKY